VLQCVAMCCSVLQDFTNKYPCCNKRTPLFRCNSLRSVLQCVAIYGSVLQCVAGYYSVLQCVAFAVTRLAVCCSVLQRIAVCCSMVQWNAVCCSVLQLVSSPMNLASLSVTYSVAVYCNVLQCVAGFSDSVLSKMVIFPRTREGKHAVPTNLYGG